MTLNEARNFLGLGPDEDPRPHMARLEATRKVLVQKVRKAPNKTIARRHRKELVDFDKAVSAIREHIETLEPALPQPPKPAPVVETTVQPLQEIKQPVEVSPRPRKRMLLWLAGLLILLTGVAGGGWIYLNHEQNKKQLLQDRIAFLERQGTIFIGNRRWQEAAACFVQIDSLDPGSKIARTGQRNIEIGINEEQKQFVGYWVGQGIAELEAGRLEASEAAARKVLEKFPTDPEATQILERVETARANQSQQKAIEEARRLLDERQWEAAATAARRILEKYPKDRDAKAILTDATAAIKKLLADKKRAEELFKMAKQRDKGVFDQQMLDWLREAATLAPEKAEIAALLEKMASYTRTYRVPGDFETPAEALAIARDRDRIVIAEQTWKGPLVINASIELQGAGSSKTIIECAPANGCSITIGPDAKGVRISGMAFRHESFLADGSERFAAALVRGGSATFVDCRFSGASGHGLAVIEGGQAVANRCRFTDNGWNGAAVMGQGSKLEVRDSESLDNFEHGIESWQGATCLLVNNRCEGNSRNGIHADNRAAAVSIEGNKLIANREFGLVLSSAGSGKVSGNIARDNLMGGFVIRVAATAVEVTGNQATNNRGPGIVLEKGLLAKTYISNIAKENIPQQVLSDAALDHADGHPTPPAE